MPIFSKLASRKINFMFKVSTKWTHNFAAGDTAPITKHILYKGIPSYQTGKIVFQVKKPSELEKSMNKLSKIENLNNEYVNGLLENPIKNMEKLKLLQLKAHDILVTCLDKPIVSKFVAVSQKDDFDIIIIKDMPFKSSKYVHLGELIQLGIAKILNMNAFTYVNEHNGRLLHHLKPKIDEANKQTGRSSLTELTLHTENAFDNHRPQYLSLYCLNSNKNARTALIPIQNIVDSANQELRNRIYEIGVENEFLFEVHQSFSAGLPTVGPLIYFKISNGGFNTRYCYSEHFTKGTTERAKQLLKDINKHVDTNREELESTSHILEAGDVLLWNNQTVLHGRSAYKPKFDDKNERHLIRMYLTRDLKQPQLRD